MDILVHNTHTHYKKKKTEKKENMISYHIFNDY